MNTTYRLPESLESDLETFRIQTERFRKDEISFAEYRAFRVPRGIYEQREEGTHMLRVRLPAGAILPHQMECLARISRRYGDRVLHVTGRQGIQVHGVALGDLHPSLVELFDSGLSTKSGGGNTVRNITACPGAATCKLGLCFSRGLARAVSEELSADSLDLEALGDLNIHISGCPNSCGRHPIGNIGLSGAARRVDGRPVPHYVLQLGGRLGEEKTRLAGGRWTIPARRAPVVVAGFLRAYAVSREFPDFHAFVDGPGRSIADQLTAENRDVPSFDAAPEFYSD